MPVACRICKSCRVWAPGARTWVVLEQAAMCSVAQVSTVLSLYGAVCAGLYKHDAVASATAQEAGTVVFLVRVYGPCVRAAWCVCRTLAYFASARAARRLQAVMCWALFYMCRFTHPTVL